MKTAYIKPGIDVQTYMAEFELLSSTNTSVIISGGGYSPIQGGITEVEDEGGEPSGAKGGDFFDEPIATSSLWGDEEEY